MTGIFLPPNYNKLDSEGYFGYTGVMKSWSCEPRPPIQQIKKQQIMTDRDFAYWLKGFFEIANPETITKEQIQIIKDHLDLVFNKVTPSRPAWTGFSGYSSYSGVSC